jgi:hypothetical protein
MYDVFSFYVKNVVSVQNCELAQDKFNVIEMCAGKNYKTLRAFAIQN